MASGEPTSTDTPRTLRHPASGVLAKCSACPTNGAGTSVSDGVGYGSFVKVVVQTWFVLPGVHAYVCTPLLLPVCPESRHWLPPVIAMRASPVRNQRCCVGKEEASQSCIVTGELFVPPIRRRSANATSGGRRMGTLCSSQAEVGEKDPESIRVVAVLKRPRRVARRRARQKLNRCTYYKFGGS
jgi:hypothetical protein